MDLDLYEQIIITFDGGHKDDSSPIKEKALQNTKRHTKIKRQNMLLFHKLKMAFTSRNRLNLSFDMCHQMQDFQSLMMC